MNKILQSLVVAGLALSMVGCGGDKEVESVSSTASKDKTEEVKNNTSEKENEKETETTSSKKKTSSTSKKNTSKDEEDDDEPLTPKEQKEKEAGFVVDKSKFPKGEYYIAATGMHVRKRTSVNSTAVYRGFNVGDVVEVSSTKTGEDDPSTVWGKIKSPVSGWICIADKAHCYLMTPEEWAEENGTNTKQLEAVYNEETGNADIKASSEEYETSGYELDEDGNQLVGKDKTVTVLVEIEWQGAAKDNLSDVGDLQLTLHDNEGPCTVTLNADNNWSAKFKLAKGVAFWCELDFSEYPFITEFDYKWNVSTGVFTYYVS